SVQGRKSGDSAWRRIVAQPGTLTRTRTSAPRHLEILPATRVARGILPALDRPIQGPWLALLRWPLATPPFPGSVPILTKARSSWECEAAKLWPSQAVASHRFCAVYLLYHRSAAIS